MSSPREQATANGLSSSSPSYIDVDRTRLENREHLGNQQQQQTATSPTTMQRWYAESLNDQPYHNMSAVKDNIEYGGGDGRSQGQGLGSRSGVGYLNANDRN